VTASHPQQRADLVTGRPARAVDPVPRPNRRLSDVRRKRLDRCYPCKSQADDAARSGLFTVGSLKGRNRPIRRGRRAERWVRIGSDCLIAVGLPQIARSGGKGRRTENRILFLGEATAAWTRTRRCCRAAISVSSEETAVD